MYQLNVNQTTKNRINSVFESLSSLENSHKAKETDYVMEAEISEEMAEISLEADNKKEFEFKMPSINLYKRELELNGNNREAKHQKIQPDYVLNPEKWKKYSLEDVQESQMNASANFFAAINFLKEKNVIKESEEEYAEPVVFNKPLKGNNRPRKDSNSKIEKKLLENLSEEKLAEYDIENQPKKEEFGFKKKASKNIRILEKNIRKPVQDNEENEPEQTDDVQMENSLSQCSESEFDDLKENENLDYDVDTNDPFN